MSQQQEFNFTRASQLALIRRAELPASGGASAQSQKHVLSIIDDHTPQDKDRWRLRLQTIAAAAGCSVPTARRAVAALEAAGVLIKKRTGRASFFKICWPNLMDFDPANQPADEPQMITLSDQGDHSEGTRRSLRKNMVITQSDQGDHSEGTRRSLRKNMVITQSDQGDHSTITQPLTQLSPPPLTTWAAVEEKLIGLRMDHTAGLLDAARQRVGPDHVLALIEHHSQLTGVGVGALHARIRSAHPSRPVEEGWIPAADPAYKPPSLPPDLAREVLRGKIMKATGCRDEEELNRMVDRKLGVLNAAAN